MASGSTANSLTPKKLGRPMACDAVETRTRLLLEARRSFANAGFDATTNRAIADAVGITTGAIYHYFPSKLDLYVAVYAEVQDLVYSAFEHASDDHRHFVDKFSAILDSLVKLNVADPSLTCFVVGVAAESQRHPELMVAIKPFRERNSQFLHQLCANAIAQGQIHDDISVYALQDLIDVLLSGLARFSTVTNDNDRGSAAITALKHFVAGTAVRAPATL
ncbi:MAG: TetR/AcrR family transcriptional regulator [Ilumatobacteraceae bacterium]